ncbi:MAG TPA: hypothetical protein VKU01_02625 [Bryobacteraceae bacterium]|nr:hypothetical protein [Bryobacteraceae bacterium]
MARLKGSLWALLLYEVADEIRLDEAREVMGAERPERRPEFRRPTPEYVRFAQPPVVYSGPAVQLDTGDRWTSVVKFYNYGVVSVALELPFECNWDELTQLSSRWIGSNEIERQTADIARAQVARIGKALIKPFSEVTSEDYYAVHVREACADDGHVLTARELLAQHGDRVSQIVRGESVELAESETQEILRECVSYYPTDLLVVAWMAAFLYDTPEGAAPILQLLEYANTQLVEFRYYDDLLTKVLASVYRSLERRRGILRRWKIGAEAERLNQIRLDVIELTERVDNSIKFLSDMFYARAYRLAARKIGVPDYRDLVDEKLKTAGELYQSMVEEFHQGRAFLLEAMVVAILIIELVFLFRGIP